VVCSEVVDNCIEGSGGGQKSGGGGGKGEGAVWKGGKWWRPCEACPADGTASCVDGGVSAGLQEVTHRAVTKGMKVTADAVGGLAG
jgi:hypothetical protein